MLQVTLSAAASKNLEGPSDEEDANSQLTPSSSTSTATQPQPSKKSKKGPITSQVAEVLSGYLAQKKKEESEMNKQVIIYACSFEIS